MKKKIKKSIKKPFAKKELKQIQYPLRDLLVRILILISVIGLFIIYSDKKGYFNPDETNNHTIRKWNNFYDLSSKKNEIEIMLFGNSHLYTGINPKNLSLAVDATSFIFASPGTHIGDSYYCLKEAIKEQKPKLVIVETYGMNDFYPYELSKGALSDQFKSFSARKDFTTKLLSTPKLFSLNNYLYAWSSTIRNHDFLFTNQKQLKINRSLIDKKIKQRRNNKLYLGRYVRFTTGIEDEVLKRYQKEGAPVKGTDYQYSRYTPYYVSKIVDLCKKENIKLMFLTLPMYEKHISEYDVWDDRLTQVLGQYPNKWLNMQKSPGYNGFDVFAFENTYKKNQHMTYNGSLMATYKLADFIRDSLSIEFSSKQNDIKWHKLFYGEEGYFENFNPIKNDENNKVISSNKILQNVTLKSLLHLNIGNKNSNQLIAKVDKQLLEIVNYQNTFLRIVLIVEAGGREQLISLDLKYDKFHMPENEFIFTSYVRPLKIKDVADGALVKKEGVN